jgi:hypothetical protein
MILALGLGLSLLQAESAYAQQGNPGAIWTTRSDCGTEQQNVNRYLVGEMVYINGQNFNAGTYDWTINQPGNKDILVASGTLTVDASGTFCLPVYTVQVSDSGEYSVKVGNKNDNFQTAAVVSITIASASAAETPAPAPASILPATGTDVTEQHQQAQQALLNLGLGFLAVSLLVFGFWLKRKQKES